MQDLFVDVTFEVPLADLFAQPDPERYLVEKMREGADRLCDEHGARLRTDRRPEFHLKRATHKVTHEDVLLCASRWAVIAPDETPVAY